MNEKSASISVAISILIAGALVVLIDSLTTGVHWEMVGMWVLGGEMAIGVRELLLYARDRHADAG